MSCPGSGPPAPAGWRTRRIISAVSSPQCMEDQVGIPRPAGRGGGASWAAAPVVRRSVNQALIWRGERNAVFQRVRKPAWPVHHAARLAREEHDRLGSLETIASGTHLGIRLRAKRHSSRSAAAVVGSSMSLVASRNGPIVIPIGSRSVESAMYRNAEIAGETLPAQPRTRLKKRLLVPVSSMAAEK